MSSLNGLFEFRTGDDITRFNNRNEDVLWGGFIWYKAPIIPGVIRQSPEQGKNPTEFTFPVNSTFAQQFLGYGPDQVTTVTVRRNRFDDPEDFQVVWKGRIADVEADTKTITLLGESILTTIKGTGLGPRMQKFCRHVVYYKGCNLDKDLFVVPTPVTAIDNYLLRVTAPGAAAFPDGYFAGGMIQMPHGALRYITSHIGDQLIMWRPAPEIARALVDAGDEDLSLNIYPGCDKSLNTCHTRFQNTDNNGGYYWIPSVNMYGGGSIL